MFDKKPSKCKNVVYVRVHPTKNVLLYKQFGRWRVGRLDVWTLCLFGSFAILLQIIQVYGMSFECQFGSSLCDEMHCARVRWCYRLQTISVIVSLWSTPEWRLESVPTAVLKHGRAQIKIAALFVSVRRDKVQSAGLSTLLILRQTSQSWNA